MTPEANPSNAAVLSGEVTTFTEGVLDPERVSRYHYAAFALKDDRTLRFATAQEVRLFVFPELASKEPRRSVLGIFREYEGYIKALEENLPKATKGSEEGTTTPYTDLWVALGAEPAFANMSVRDALSVARYRISPKPQSPEERLTMLTGNGTPADIALAIELFDASPFSPGVRKALLTYYLWVKDTGHDRLINKYVGITDVRIIAELMREALGGSGIGPEADRRVTEYIKVDKLTKDTLRVNSEEKTIRKLRYVASGIKRLHQIGLKGASTTERKKDINERARRLAVQDIKREAELEGKTEGEPKEEFASGLIVEGLTTGLIKDALRISAAKLAKIRERLIQEGKIKDPEKKKEEPKEAAETSVVLMEDDVAIVDESVAAGELQNSLKSTGIKRGLCLSILMK